MPLSLGPIGARRFMFHRLLEIRYNRQRMNCLKDDSIVTEQNKFYSLLVMPVHCVIGQGKCLI
jgi:hypothetical protein